MSIQEQQETKTKGYAEAIRYMNNAKKHLQDANKDGNYYKDVKYVKTACSVAYFGVLLALDYFFLLKGIKPPTKGRKSIEYYTKNVAQLDKTLLKRLNGAYKILHLSGSYDGIDNVNVVQEGLKEAYAIIEKINPNPNP